MLAHPVAGAVAFGVTWGVVMGLFQWVGGPGPPWGYIVSPVIIGLVVIAPLGAWTNRRAAERQRQAPPGPF
jgi:hypothetical protein